MTKEIDVAFLKNAMFKWERRFIDGEPYPSIKVMTAIKDDFVSKYGVDEARRVFKEIMSEINARILSEPIVDDEIIPIQPIFPQGEQQFYPPKPPRRRSRIVRRPAFF